MPTQSSDQMLSRRVMEVLMPRGSGSSHWNAKYRKFESWAIHVLVVCGIFSPCSGLYESHSPVSDGASRQASSSRTPSITGGRCTRCDERVGLAVLAGTAGLDGSACGAAVAEVDKVRRTSPATTNLMYKLR